MEAVEALALVGGHVDEELLVRNEYLAAENRILKSNVSLRVMKLFVCSYLKCKIY